MKSFVKTWNALASDLPVYKQQRLLFDSTSSQFSHKQLVLVTAPVSTGALLFLYPSGEVNCTNSISYLGAENVCYDISLIKTTVGNIVPLNVFNDDPVKCSKKVNLEERTLCF